jgi:hypothetical protein
MPEQSRDRGNGALAHQILVFAYHKSGSSLFEKVMGRIAARFGWQVATRYGRVLDLDRQTDIFILSHSLLGLTLRRPYRGVRIIRDPRDIWVSGYLYHRHCSEGWCISTDFNLAPPILFPRVDFSVQHRPERWKRDSIKRLGGRSYQQNLLERDRADGLAFELAGYTGATLDAMRLWSPKPEVIDVQLEQVSASFDSTMLRVFRHLGFDEAQCAAALAEAAAEDVARMDDAVVASNAHIHSRTLSKWRDVLTAAQVAGFESRYADLITGLGYELSGT